MLIDASLLHLGLRAVTYLVWAWGYPGATLSRGRVAPLSNGSA